MTATSSQKYKRLRSELEKKGMLESVNMLLDWDLKTYMPPKAAASRAGQQAYLSELTHKIETSRSYRNKLESLIDIESGEIKDDCLPKEIQSSLKVLRREFLQQKKLPVAFVKNFSEYTAKAYLVWAKAKKTNNFKIFLPYLNKIVELCRKKADYLGYTDHPYDALLGVYEPEMTAFELKSIFDELQKGLTKILTEIPKIDTSVLKGTFPKQKQIEVSKQLLEFVGLHSDYCRLDESVHPFCTSFHPTDVRLTTKILEDNLMSCIGSVLHEAGHGLYQHQLPSQHFGEPLGSYCSLGIHESQSRFFEVFLGKTKAFWNYFYPHLQKAFPSQLGSVSQDLFYRAIHEVKPSLIRIESDEVTYNLHIMVRFECEMAFMEGSLQAKDLPDFWNDRMNKYLGLSPTNFSTGCLQDVHWSGGAMGYFPTYTLGNIAAASLFIAFQKEHPDWQSEIALGKSESVCHFLEEKIHRHGRQGSSKDLLKQAINKDFVAKDLIEYLSQKYASF